MSSDGPLVPTAAQLQEWGLEPSWSRTVVFPGADGAPVTWHVLDTGPGPRGTVVCVHGNPTWAYLWHDLLAALAGEWRVVAVDQTGMGFSERGRPRRLANRIEELVTFCRQETSGPLVLVAHDWGGPVAVGAAAELDVRALVLANTAVAKPDDVRVPPLIAAARRTLDLTCRRTPTFVAGTARMTERRHRAALRAPYATPERREAVRDFVADIPLGPDDPSFSPLAGVADTLAAQSCPTLLVWGGRDPVFHDGFLRDLRARVPHADVERFADVGHLSPLDPRTAPAVARWLDRVLPDAAAPVTAAAGPDAAGPGTAGPDPAPSSLLAALDATADAGVLYVGPDGALTGAELAARSEGAAAALVASGLAPGDRVAVLVPPSRDLLVVVAAIWKAGGVAVVADASGGLPALRRLLRAQAPRVVVGTAGTLAVARAGGLAPRATAAAFADLPGVVHLRAVPRTRGEPVVVTDADLAAIVHTSGATGPAKAVRYRHRALGAQVDVVRRLLDAPPGGAFTSSFGPFMLLAPLLGLPFVRVEVRGELPSRFGFDDLATAVRTAPGPLTAAWLSPASARRIVETATGRTAPVGLVMLAGAPIGPDLAGAIAAVTGADVRAPYGMTECLPVTDGTDPDAVGSRGGTSTGRPLPGALVDIVPLGDAHAAVSDDHPGAAGDGWGEIVVHAPWMFDGYEGAWATNDAATLVRDGVRFHRTGDVGYLEDGVLFSLGRLAHVIDTAAGPVASVAVEMPITAAVGAPVAAVAVGPAGVQRCAVVVEHAAARRSPWPRSSSVQLAPATLAAAVRAAAPVPVAAVLTGRLPVDHRHQSKIDRVTLAADVRRFLAGR